MPPRRQLSDSSTGALGSCENAPQPHSLGRRLLLSSAAVTCFAAIPAGDSCLIASPLVRSASQMSSTPTFSCDIFLLFRVHRCEPSEPSRHSYTSLNHWMIRLNFRPNTLYPSMLTTKLNIAWYFVLSGNALSYHGITEAQKWTPENRFQGLILCFPSSVFPGSRFMRSHTAWNMARRAHVVYNVVSTSLMIRPSSRRSIHENSCSFCRSKSLAASMRCSGMPGCAASGATGYGRLAGSTTRASASG